MLNRYLLFGLLIIVSLTSLATAQEAEEALPFPVFPETTDLGSKLCQNWVTWSRGLPPCFKTTAMHGAFVRYPTRQKARIIVDSYLADGLYERSVVASFFGTLMVGTYRPEAAAPIGDFWDAGYFGLVKLDYRVEAKNMLWDVVLQRDWAEGKFLDERYKALGVLSKERLITLREYKELKAYLEEQLNGETLDVQWTNALVKSLSSFREWNEDLLPLFRQVYDKMAVNEMHTVLQAFLDFDVPDDGSYILDRVLNGEIEDIEDKKLCIRAAYVLDDEYAYNKLTELKDSFKDDEEIDPAFKEFVINTIERLNWFGKWEITATENTWDDGLDTEKISFKMAHSLDEMDDSVNFSMPMQLNDPEELKPIGQEDTYLTNNVTFIVTPEILDLNIYKPFAKMTYTKHFELKEGTGRNEGKIYLRFPLEGETDRRGNQKYGWVEIEKVS